MTEKPNQPGSTILRKAKTAVRLPFTTVMLSLLIWMLIWPSRLITLMIPIRHLMRFLGEDRGLNAQIAEPKTAADYRVQRLTTAMDLATRYHPLSDTCYAEALIAHQFLNRMSVSHVINFGVRRADTDVAMEAHAWVMAGTIPVSGGRSSGDYTVVRCFVTE